MTTKPENEKSIKWRRSYGATKYTFVNGCKVSLLSCGLVIVEQCDDILMPMFTIGVYDTLDEAWVAATKPPSAF